MITVIQPEDQHQLEEQTFGYLHVRHEFANVILHVGNDGDFTRTENSGLTPEDQDSLKEQLIRGGITLINPSGSGVRLSNIHIQLDVDELERSMDYDVALVEPETGQLNLDIDHLEPGEDTSCGYSWIVTNKFGEIGADFPVVFSIRPSYTVTMLAVDQGTQRDKTQDIGVAIVSVSG